MPAGLRHSVQGSWKAGVFLGPSQGRNDVCETVREPYAHGRSVGKEVNALKPWISQVRTYQGRFLFHSTVIGVPDGHVLILSSKSIKASRKPSEGSVQNALSDGSKVTPVKAGRMSELFRNDQKDPFKVRNRQ
jgi:hypothetical protein